MMINNEKCSLIGFRKLSADGVSKTKPKKKDFCTLDVLPPDNVPASFTLNDLSKFNIKYTDLPNKIFT